MKMFCRNLKCLKAADFENSLLKFCPFCSEPYINTNVPAGNASKQDIPEQLIKAKVSDDRLPFWKRKNIESKQRIREEEEDDGEPIIIPNVNPADVKIDVGSKNTLGNIIKNGNSAPVRGNRSLEPEAEKVLNEDLQNILNLARQQYPNQSVAPAPRQLKASKSPKTKPVAKKKR